MKISTRLKINIVLSAAVVLILSTAFLTAFLVERKANKQVDFAEDLSRWVYDLSLLTEYYIRYHEDRPRVQWEIGHDAVSKLVREASLKHGQRDLYLEMNQDLKEAGILFNELVATYESRRSGPAERGFDEQIMKAKERQLIDTITLRLRNISGAATRITMESTQAINDVTRDIAILFSALAGMMLILAVFFSVRIRRAVSVPIEKLQEGTEIVREGDLDHRIGIVSDDEFGQLSTSFNQMTEHLKRTTVSRDELMREIAFRRHAEEALQRQAALIDLSPDGIMVRLLDGRITFWSRGAEEMYGWTKDEAVGETTYTLLHPRFPERIDQVNLEIMKTGRWSGELVHRTKDGREIVVQSFWLAMFDPAGSISEILESNIDITGRKHVEDEIRKFNTELERLVGERTAKLEIANRELESFSYSVSHDLRTPLRAIEGFTRILTEEYGGSLDDEGKRITSVIIDNVKNMSRLIDDLLAFSRVGRYELKYAPVDMGAMVRSVLGEIMSPEDAQRTTVIVHPIPDASADTSLIRQVWANLVSNAIKFTSKKEKPVIEVGGRIEDSDTVTYYVKDNGVGFDMAYVNKLFGVFQRLHSVKEFPGTGIGLALVQRIVFRHGGKVWAEGVPGQGATFSFSLPVSNPVSDDKQNISDNKSRDAVRKDGAT